MSNIDYYSIALKKAKEMGYDTIRPAGERDGWRFFIYFRWATRGHKLGLPHVMQISENGKEIAFVEDRDVILWAIRQKSS